MALLKTVTLFPNLLLLFFLISTKRSYSLPQSNYAEQTNSIEYPPSEVGLPEHATLDGKVTKLDDLAPVIFLNRTKAVLNCAGGSMLIEMKFNEPFYGIAYAAFDRTSTCQVHGKGATSYKLQLPLKGCGTKQEPQRVFTNNIVVRFHPTLEIDGDEIITIVCRYPPPVAPVPAAPIGPLVVPPPVSPVTAALPLKGFQILLIVCGILFLSLLLVGLACSYYCLRRRNMLFVKRLTSAPPSASGGLTSSLMDSGSEITKLSGSSLGKLPIFEDLKIPRVHAPLSNLSPTTVAIVHHSPPPGSSDGLQQISDTLPSDYPSESHSSEEYEEEMEDGYEEEEEENERRSPQSISQSSSAHSYTNKAYYHTEIEQGPKTPSPPPPPPLPPLQPKFNVEVRVQPKMEDIQSLAPSTIVSDYDELDTHLSTIPEMREESLKSSIIATPPTYSRILRRQQQQLQQQQQPKPDISSHLIDDVFLKTITEKRTIEDIERHKRLVTEYRRQQQQMSVEPQSWDVTIRNLRDAERNADNWETFSDVSTISQASTRPPSTIQRPIVVAKTLEDNKLPLNSPELVGNLQGPSTVDDNWQVLTRVLQHDSNDFVQSPVIECADEFNAQLTPSDKLKWRQIITTESTLRTLLTEAKVREDFERIRRDVRYEKLFEPVKWDVIIRILAPPPQTMHSSSLGGPSIGSGAIKKNWDTRSRRSSLPTLYEYEVGDDDDSDGEGTLIEGAPGDGTRVGGERRSMDGSGIVLRRGSRSSYRSDADLRSMSEVTVDFRRQSSHLQDIDNQSEASSLNYQYYQPSLVHSNKSVNTLQRSLSQPSLARSASEFSERQWAIVQHTHHLQAETVSRSAGGEGSEAHAALMPSIDFYEEPFSSSTETTPKAVRRSPNVANVTNEERIWQQKQQSFVYKRQ